LYNSDEILRTLISFSYGEYDGEPLVFVFDTSPGVDMVFGLINFNMIWSDEFIEYSCFELIYQNDIFKTYRMRHPISRIYANFKHTIRMEREAIPVYQLGSFLPFYTPGRINWTVSVEAVKA
jgi:hypothetical protein